MTEREWLGSSYPQDLLEYLLGRAGARRLRLFACACCRHREVWRLLQSRQSRALVEAAERFADAEAAWAEVVEAASAAPTGRVSGGSWRSTNPVRLPRSSQAERAVLALAREDAWEAAWGVVREAMNLLGSAPCAILREVVGNPFRPLRPRMFPAPVVGLAQSCYEAFPSVSGDYHILADAKE